jgi:prolyl 4-hydroxylase
MFPRARVPQISETGLQQGLSEDSTSESEMVLSSLRALAERGDASAKAALAEWLLTRPPYRLEEGVSWALSGARDRNGDAAHLAALLTAWGLGVARDWQMALEFLTVAAKAGHAYDSRVLAGLAGYWQLARSVEAGERLTDSQCTALRDRIRIEELLRIPPGRYVSQSPRVGVIERFLAPEMCDWLIARARPNLEPAKVYDPSTGIHGSTVRTNSEFHIGTFSSDLIVMLLQHRIAALTQLKLAGMEACTILHYAPGEEFKPHADYFDITKEENARIVAADGQRVLTFLICLNEEFTGGETEFPHLRWRFRGRRGDALWFVNITPDFAPDPRTLHAGLPPHNGEKWMFSQWIRGRKPS